MKKYLILLFVVICLCGCSLFESGPVRAVRALLESEKNEVTGKTLFSQTIIDYKMLSCRTQGDEAYVTAIVTSASTSERLVWIFRLKNGFRGWEVNKCDCGIEPYTYLPPWARGVDGRNYDPEEHHSEWDK